MAENRFGRRDFLAGAAGLSAAAALAACAPAAPATPESKPAAEPTKAAGAPTTAPAAPTTASAAPMPLKYKTVPVHRYLTGGFTQPGPEDNLIKQIQEEALKKEYGLNIDIQFESASWADIDTLMELRLQTQACDSLQRHHRSVLRWISTPGLIRDIDAEVKEYGKNLLEAYPKAAFEFWMREDKKYIGVPAVRATPCDIEYLTIRRDWLDKVNRDIPKDLSELEECLRLFKEKGLGGGVTIPLTNENPQWMLGAFVVGPFHPEPEKQFKMIQDGVDIDMSGNFDEERLDMLARWIKDGLLNKEWATWKYDQVYDAAAKGMIGCISGGWWVLNNEIRQKVKPADPKQDWVQIFPPLGLKGKPETGRVRAGGPMERAFVVTSWAPAPEAIVALADWENKSFDNFLTSRLGIKGKHWDLNPDGTLNDKRKPAPNSEYSGMRSTTWTIANDMKRQMMPKAKGQEDIFPLITKRIYSSYNTRKVANVPERQEMGEYPTLGRVDRYCPYFFPKSQKLVADMTTAANESFAKIINGEVKVSDGTKAFWERYKKSGWDVQAEEIRDQYNKWIASRPEWKEAKATLDPSVWNTKPEFQERPKA